MKVPPPAVDCGPSLTPPFPTRHDASLGTYGPPSSPVGSGGQPLSRRTKTEKGLGVLLSLAVRPLRAVRHAAQRPPPGAAAHKPWDTHARGAPRTTAAHGPRLPPVRGAWARRCAPARSPDRAWHAGDERVGEGRPLIGRAARAAGRRPPAAATGGASLEKAFPASTWRRNSVPCGRGSSRSVTADACRRRTSAARRGARADAPPAACGSAAVATTAAAAVAALVDGQRRDLAIAALGRDGGAPPTGWPRRAGCSRGLAADGTGGADDRRSCRRRRRRRCRLRHRHRAPLPSVAAANRPVAAYRASAKAAARPQSRLRQRAARRPPARWLGRS
ncbi:hypothetical protein BU14_0192s0012 [Porphyra umbilicalis]|uniref:Uncharacterized protein n=1 Tax=Porphyra umbilicalis TaxID=2786 RepID=A0A1X6P6L4_PORUM|nr:hypothetical protein BU14_0192s0012 [Porphyra umbilicalis]|eukprot:OSX76395.1 hypothetical protein BU14_0192s0012 [Porphyra umbilicalis]